MKQLGQRKREVGWVVCPTFAEHGHVRLKTTLEVAFPPKPIGKGYEGFVLGMSRKGGVG